MANSKSAAKRARQNLKHREQNRVYRSTARTAVKNARQLIARGDEGAADAVRIAEKALDRAAAKGIIHGNNAARRKSRLKAALDQSLAA